RGVSSSVSPSPSSRMARALLVATYSIAACDPEAGQWGVATQSKFLAVGSVVPWAEPGVGAIATQAYANPRYGPDGLALLREGLSADEVVERLTSADDGRDHRQVGVVDREGRAATYSGAECLEWAGGRTGNCYAAQGNILVSEATVDAIAKTFEAGSGPLAERLLDCLDAAQAAGGDRRGQQSAALLIDELESFPIAGQDGLTWRPIRRYFDIRAFGVNAYTAEEAGQRVVEEHREQDGHEELYVVVSGRATFTVEGREHDARAGTLVHC